MAIKTNRHREGHVPPSNPSLQDQELPDQSLVSRQIKTLNASRLAERKTCEIKVCLICFVPRKWVWWEGPLQDDEMIAMTKVAMRKAMAFFHSLPWKHYSRRGIFCFILEGCCGSSHPQLPLPKKDSTATSTTTTISNKSRAIQLLPHPLLFQSCHTHIRCDKKKYFLLAADFWLFSFIITIFIFIWCTFSFIPPTVSLPLTFHFILLNCLFELAQKDHYAKDIVRPWINWPMSMGKSYARKYVESPQQWHSICISIFSGNTFNILPVDLWRSWRGHPNRM